METNKLTHLKGISQKRSEALEKLGITTIGELITYFPKSYQDYSILNTLDQAFESGDQKLLVRVKILSSNRVPTKNRIPMYKMVVQDSVATANLLSFGHKGQYLKANPNKYYLVSGVFKYNYGKIECSSFTVEGIIENKEQLENKTQQYTQIVPFYALTPGITQKLLRSFIKQALEMSRTNLKENLPYEITDKYEFLPRYTSLYQMHFPENFQLLSAAKKRLKYMELFRLQFQFALKQLYFKSQKPQIYKPPFIQAQNTESSLPFLLTSGQKKALKEIEIDLLSSRAMHRLIMGDVGSGKTLVAFLSLLKIIESGYQGVFLAPTEVLAKQHFNTFTKLVSLLEIKIDLLTGSTKNKERKDILEALKNGDTQLLIGTHAVFSNSVEFYSLGMVVIDEQHKFGVEQRMDLVRKGIAPDVLVMSATPIPRTLGHISFGDMDISIIKDKPIGRLPIQTHWIEEEKLDIAYSFMDKEVQKGHQGYIIYPLVQESEKSDLKSVTEGFTFLQNKIFPQYKLTLLHGQMGDDEKTTALKAFSSGQSQILVSTMIIEVGVDVPNATCMIIENATRFGLSTLHQLRGRIGRNALASTCYVVSAPKSSLTFEATERMKIIEECDDGFILAEKDMELRGMGNLIGKNQSGRSGLKLANIINDAEILEQARNDAFAILQKDPKCESSIYRLFQPWISKFEEEVQAMLHN